MIMGVVDELLAERACQNKPGPAAIPVPISIGTLNIVLNLALAGRFGGTARRSGAAQSLCPAAGTVEPHPGAAPPAGSRSWCADDA
jgi:hypothetical protein